MGVLDGFPYVDLREREVQTFFAGVAAERAAKEADLAQQHVFAQHPDPQELYAHMFPYMFASERENDDVIAHPHGEHVQFEGDADDYFTDDDDMVGLLSQDNDGQRYLDRNEYALINTVHENFEGFTKREVNEAKMARDVQLRVGNPTDKQFNKLVSANKIRNCPILPQHIANASKIFGPSTAGLEEAPRGSNLIG